MSTATADSFQVDTSVFSSLDRRFVLVLGLSVGAHFALATWLHAQPAPLEADQADEGVDRFRPISLSPLRPIPHFAPLQAPARAAAVRTPAAAPAPPARGVTDVRKTGLLEVIGARGLEGVLPDDTSTRAALDGARVAVLADLRAGERRGSLTGQREEVREVGTDGAQAVRLAEQTGRFVPGRLADATVEIDDPGYSPQLLHQFIALRRSALQSCYEQQLQRHRDLRGKLTVRLSIAVTGRAQAVEVADETMGSPEVAACVRATVGRWVFPVKPESDVPVAFPLVFAPAS